jgi:hypothetical protein
MLFEQASWGTSYSYKNSHNNSHSIEHNRGIVAGSLFRGFVAPVNLLLALSRLSENHFRPLSLGSDRVKKTNLFSPWSLSGAQISRQASHDSSNSLSTRPYANLRAQVS